MKDQLSTHQQYAKEVARLRRRITELEVSAAASRRTEESLRLSLRQWHDALGAMSDAVALLEPDGTIYNCNDAMLELVGRTLTEVLGARCCEIVHGLPEPAQTCPLVRMRQTHQKERVRLQIHGRWFDIRVDPIWGDSGALVGAVHTMSDVTDRTRMEERFRQARKTESIAQLAAGVAHEFNNLLTAIIGYADLMRIQLPETDPMQDHVGRIRAAGHRAAEATRRLLAFGRKQVMRPSYLTGCVHRLASAE